MVIKSKACLVGPFIGDLYWECYRFAPYIIHLKKKYPETKFVVFTRPQSFDLYGQYADILVPLTLRNNKRYTPNCFGLKGLKVVDYKTLNSFFVKKYKPNYDSIERVFPDVDAWRYKVKWQFPRDKMDFDFLPRKSNIKLLRSRITMKNIVFIDFDDEEHLGFTKMDFDKYNYISLNWLEDFASIYRDGIKNSYVGMLIEILKKASFVIGRCDKFASKLGLLLGVPLVTINDETSWDAISLINPQNTLVVKCENFSEGVSAYEDNF